MRRPSRLTRRLLVELLEDRTLPDASGLGLFDALHTDVEAFANDRILVRLRDGAAMPAPKGLPAQADDLLGWGWYEVDLPDDVSVADALAVYRNDPNVLMAQPDYRVSVDRLPNDPNFGQLWGLNNTGQSGGRADADIDAPEAWDVTTGSGRMVVAVLDTGVDYTHPDLAANMWRNPGEIAGNGRDDDGNGYVDDVYGYDFANNDATPMDDNGHGTHVAGTIGAVGNNGYGIVGVNWNVKLMAVKFLQADGNGSTSNAIRALKYAVDNGAKISNNSWGGGSYDQALYNAIASARSQGHIFVAAAGNSSRNNDASPTYPANYQLDNVVTVAALNNMDQLASFSNFGVNTVELGAPGVNIYSTLPGGRYGTLSGTSMATPHVTGALALVWDHNPGMTYRQVIDQVLSTTTPVVSLAGKTITGGKLNLAAALGVGNGGGGGGGDGDVIPGAYVTGMTVHKADNIATGVRLTFNKAIDPTTFTAGDVKVRKGTTSYTVVNVQPVNGTGNTQFDVSFPSLTAFGNYTVTVGPDIRDLQGKLMNQDRDATAGEATADQYNGAFSLSGVIMFAAADMPKPIRDRQTISSLRTISRTDVFVTHLSVQITLAHTWVGDLRVWLKGPGNREVLLVNRRGGSGDNMTQMVLDDDAGQSIVDASAPFTGTFRPEGSLSVFDNRSAYGSWRLYVQDQSLGDTGTLLGWSLIIEPRYSVTAFGAQAKEQLAVQNRPKLEASWFASRRAVPPSASMAPTLRAATVDFFAQGRAFPQRQRAAEAVARAAAAQIDSESLPEWFGVTGGVFPACSLDLGVTTKLLRADLHRHSDHMRG